MADDADRDAIIGEGRLARWSRLKQGARQHGAAAPVAAPTNAQNQVAAVHPDRPDDPKGRFLEDPLGGPGRYLTPEEEAIARELPPLESLTAESDFSAFMNPNVPDILQRAALKKLWKSDPFFNFRDGLNEYDDDYNLEPLINAATDTKYHTERGMFDENDPEDPRYRERMEAEKRAKAEATGASDKVSDEDRLGDGEDETMAGIERDATPAPAESLPDAVDTELESGTTDASASKRADPVSGLRRKHS